MFLFILSWLISYALQTDLKLSKSEYVKAEKN